MDRDYRNQLKAAEIEFFVEELHITIPEISSIAGEYGIEIDQRNLRNWIKSTKSIQKSKYEDFKRFLQKYFEQYEENIDKFFDYIISKGKQQGYEKLSIVFQNKNIQKIHEGTLRFMEKIDYIEKIDTSTDNKILQSLELKQVIKSFIDISEKFGEFFKPIYIKTENRENIFPRLSVENKEHVNYIILSFCAQYNVLILINDSFIIHENTMSTFKSEIKKFMNEQSIHMTLMFTDQENITLSDQELLMNQCNLFCEIINKEQLFNASLKEITYKELQEDFSIKEKFFAQIILNRLTTYFPVIRNEILFKKINYKIPSASCSFTEWYDEIILKKLYDYRYMTRHTIYFERSRVKSALFMLQKKRLNKKKLDSYHLIEHKVDLIVEICAPNTFTSCEVIDYTKKLKLFSTSSQAIKYLNNQEKPKNIEFELGHINPEIISKHYGNELNGQCDMIILGLGMGSMIENLDDYLRHINNWLKSDGVIVISFVNTNSVLLNGNISYKLENMPIHFANYWEHQTRRSLYRFFNRVQTYKLKEAIKTLKKIEIDYRIKCATYPYFMGLTQDVKDDKTRADIRSFDKQNATKKMEGHYIFLTGFKSSTKSKCENIRKIVNTTMNRFSTQNIRYDTIKHLESIDSINLKNNLLEKKINFNEKTGNLLLKMIILKEKESNVKDTNGNNSTKKFEHYVYCILPASEKVNYNRKKYHPVPQKQIIRQYGQGPLSPAIIFPENSSVLFNSNQNSLCIIGVRKATQKNVIFTSGEKDSSFQISKKDFIMLIDSVIKSNKISLIEEKDLL